MSFDEVIQKLTMNLQAQGFGIITEIDLQEKFKQKLDITFRKYRILGACNVEFAYKAVNFESHIGLLLPCNIVIQELTNNEVDVSAINALDTIGRIDAAPELTDLAREVSNRLRTVVDDISGAKSV